MKIGVLTFYKVQNFGANLQAISTYCYLKNNGHEPIFINYMSNDVYNRYVINKDSLKWRAHIETVDNIISQQSDVCFNSEDILKVVNMYELDGLIIGSDALLQHHPLISRIRRGKRKPIQIIKKDSDSMFPNPFWGCGLAKHIPTALMSVSSQNSSYKFFSNSSIKKMGETLHDMVYISVRDEWTLNMIKYIDSRLSPNLTPDPVFAFNANAFRFIPKREDLLKKYRLPSSYVLVSLHYQSLTYEVLCDIKRYYESKKISVVFLPMPNGQKLRHPFDYEISFPIYPLDWYALIQNSRAYIGSNMHPIVVSLHNAVPCFSIDNWGKSDFWGHKKDDGSSKILDILRIFELSENHKFIENFHCQITADEIIEKLNSFPVEKVRNKATVMCKNYMQMMEYIILSIKNSTI